MHHMKGTQRGDGLAGTFFGVFEVGVHHFESLVESGDGLLQCGEVGGDGGSVGVDLTNHFGAVHGRHTLGLQIATQHDTTQHNTTQHNTKNTISFLSTNAYINIKSMICCSADRLTSSDSIL